MKSKAARKPYNRLNVKEKPVNLDEAVSRMKAYAEAHKAEHASYFQVPLPEPEKGRSERTSFWHWFTTEGVMQMFYKRIRHNHWSFSSFIKKVRAMMGLDSPFALTKEGWDEHRRQCKEKAPFWHWLTTDGVGKLQDILYIPSDLLHSINVYISNIKNKTHVLDGGLQAGRFYDLSTRITLCLFSELEKYIEKEKGLDILEWEKALTLDEYYGIDKEAECYGKPTQQALNAMEKEVIYNWWKANKGRDLYDESGLTQAVANNLRNVVSEEFDEAYKRLDVLEKQYKKEEEEMLIRLIRIRDHLWS